VHRQLAHLGSDPGYLGEMDAASLLDYLGALRGLPRGSWRPIAERLELDPSVPVRKLSRAIARRWRRPGVHGQGAASRDGRAVDRLDPLMQREFLALVAGGARAMAGPCSSRRTTCPRSNAPATAVAIIREGRLVKIRDGGGPGSVTTRAR